MRTTGKIDWKSPSLGRYCPTQIDWARMAAFIDGEGTILINPRRSRVSDKMALPSTFYLKLGISNTDFSLIGWLRLTFGGSYNLKSSDRWRNDHPNHKDSWDWTVSSGVAAWILFNCLPYFIIKGAQAEIGIQLQESMSIFVRGMGRTLPIKIVEERRVLKLNLLQMKARGKSLESSQALRISEVS